MPSPVPSIPPLSSISDPSTRSVLQAIVDGLRVRNGELGDGNEKFLTVADLTAATSGSQSVVTSRGTSRSVATEASQAVANVIKKLSDSVMQSRIWKELDERIVRIDTPEWFQGKVGGAIKAVENIIESGNQAMAQQLTTAITNINGNIALVQDELTAASDLVGATASNVTTLQTKVGTVDAAAQQAMQLAATVDGKVRGTWSVKFDVNGYVAGVALGVDQQPGKPPRSNFVVRADTFAVGSPGINDVVPFIVQDGVCYLHKAMIGKAWIDSANIADAAIGSAKIHDLAVDTLKIKDYAVSTVFYAGGIYEATVTVNASQPCTLHMIGVFTQGTGKHRHQWTLSANGVGLHSESPLEGTTGSLAGAIDLPAGTHTCSVKCRTLSGDGRCQLLVFMRYK